MPGAGGSGGRRWAAANGDRGRSRCPAAPYCALRRGGPERDRRRGGNFGAAARLAAASGARGCGSGGATLAHQSGLAEGLRCCHLLSSVASGGPGRCGGRWVRRTAPLPHPPAAAAARAPRGSGGSGARGCPAARLARGGRAAAALPGELARERRAAVRAAGPARDRDPARRGLLSAVPARPGRSHGGTNGGGGPVVAADCVLKLLQQLVQRKVILKSV